MLSVTVPVRVGAAAVVVLGLLAACGEDDDEALSPFCQEVDDINEAFESSDDLAGFGEALKEMEVAPPEEIEEYWELVLDNWDDLVRVEAGEDGAEAEDPGEGEAVEGEAGEDEAEAEDPGEGEAVEGEAGGDEAPTDVALDPEFDVAARVVTSYLRDVCTLPIPEQ